mmetsp:Transcript_11144/g.27385  ORF Transcript_11144/g.27385 Transcript_11144/m.27385 type:complete len:121 (+) Transcript_11144:659-1021(+)
MKLQTASELLVWSILDRIVVSNVKPGLKPITAIQVKKIMKLAPFPALRQRVISEFIALGFNQTPDLTQIIVPQDRGFLQKLDERRVTLKTKFEKVTAAIDRKLCERKVQANKIGTKGESK